MHVCIYILGFPGGSDSKESACNVGEPGLIPGLGRSPGEGNSHPLQDSDLENFTALGACQVTVHEVTKSQTQLSDSLSCVCVCVCVCVAMEYYSAIKKE